MSNSQRETKIQENLWNKFVSYLLDGFLLTGTSFGLHETDYLPIGELNLVQLVEKARQEWEQAQTLFNEATEPELIDHAIHGMIAAERKYIYLLKKAQQERIVDETLYNVHETF